MAMFYKPPRAIEMPEPGGPPLAEYGPPAPVRDPQPWIEQVVPPEKEKTPPPPPPPEVVIQPVEVPPVIIPPPPDITPPTIVPPEVEEVAPEVLPDRPTAESAGGVKGPSKPPPTLLVLGPGSVIGTFMVYVGRRLVLTMAASARDEAVKMLVGALNKRMARQ